MVLLLLSGWVNESFRQAARNVNVQSCSSVLWYLGLSLPPYFYLIPWEWYHPTRSVCWQEKLLLAMPSRVVRSLFSA